MSTQPQLSPLEQLAQQAPTPSQPTQQSDLSPLEQLAAMKPQEAAKATPEDQASNIRQSMVSGMTGLPTPNMTDADKASFERGKAAGAVSAPIVAGAALGATAAPELVPSVVDKAKAVVEWAKSNPLKSYAIARIADDLGIHPFDLMHSVVKYGKNLFGDSETTK